MENSFVKWASAGLRQLLATSIVCGSIGPLDAKSPRVSWMHSEAINAEVSSLLSRMTLDEKLSQLSQYSGASETGPANAKVSQREFAANGRIGSILNLTGAASTNELQKEAMEKSRLKIPILFALDVIHGYRTIYPTPLGLSASWDPGLAERCARMAAVEATSEGIRWTFSPMVDVARDARWGRITEGNGEDPFLGGVLAAAWVRGYQGESLSSPSSMVACAKHFVAYGAAEGGRDYNAVDMSDRTLREVYLPPFKAALDAGVGTFMSGFNTLQGVPTSANPYTLTDILRTEWGFRGFVVSDWNSVGELLEHGVAREGGEAAVKALTAGVDMDMDSCLYASRLGEQMGAGRLEMNVVDQAVSRVLRLKFALGLFESPYTDVASRQQVMLRKEHLDLAREAAEDSFVLLKNAPFSGKPLLPLPGGQKVALIGELADSKEDMFGAWVLKGDPKDVTTLRESMSAKLGEKLAYARGTGPTETSDQGFAEAIQAARNADVVVMALGENKNMSGEAASRANLDLPGNQKDLLKAVVATGKPVVLVLFNGRPLTLPWEDEHVPAILEAWFPGVQAGPALVRTLFGESNPAGKLTASFPRSVGQMPIYYSKHSTGRPSLGKPLGTTYITGYSDVLDSPLYPFGWGLSYSKFSYSGTRASVAGCSAGDLNQGASLSVEATITNGGTLPGEEVVQLYVAHRGGSIARPVRELKGFQKIALSPGESKPVKLELTRSELAGLDIHMKKVVEPGELKVWIASHAQDGDPATVKIVP